LSKGGHCMKNRVIWIMFMVVALVSSSAWAVWNPNDMTGSGLQFNMNFESNHDPCTFAKVPTTIDASGHLIGQRSSGKEVNSINSNIYELNITSKPGLGTDANFQVCKDGPPITPKSAPNDVKIRIPYIGSTSTNPMFDITGAGIPSNPALVRTWACWVWTMHKDSDYFHIYPNGTFIRLERSATNYGGGEPNISWEISLSNGSVQFSQKNGSDAAARLLTVRTTQTLDDMNMTPNQWHHVAVVIDRNTRAGSKIFIDGLQRDVTVTDYRTTVAKPIADYPVSGFDVFNPLMVGSGSVSNKSSNKFNGLLDEIRLYNRALLPLEVSILKQTDDTNHPMALLPIPGSTDVPRTTDVNWVPAKTVVSQAVYFGTNPIALGTPLTTGDSSLKILYNEDLNNGKPLELSTTYYWVVDSTYLTTEVDGPLWSFTTETGKARNPTPIDGQDYVGGNANNDVNLMWDEPATHPLAYTVYLSSDQSLVEANNPTVKVPMTNHPGDSNDANLIITARGTQMYWRVISKYNLTDANKWVTGDTWTFRTKPYEIIFNTSKADNIIGKKVRYSNHDVNALAMVIHDAGWTEVQYGTVDQDVNIAVFTFPSGFNYDRRYDITVIPTYMADDIHYDLVPSYDVNTPRPLGIHVTGAGTNGNFYFDGRINISGDDCTLAQTGVKETARSGGFPGPREGSGDSSTFNDHPITGAGSIALSNYWTAIPCPSATSAAHGRVNSGNNPTGKSIYVPTAQAQSIFGPGVPANPPYKGGGGGSYGGQGGNCGRGYYFGVEVTLGRTYGDSPIPIPFGGSAGGWSGSGQGCPGGGGIEIIATGDVNLDAHSQILANGGNEIVGALGYGTGGGSGGSVKIISGGKFTNKGHIEANGGKGSDATQANNGGGGGGGGRVAINYVTAGSTQGAVDVNGAAHGYYADPLNPNIPDNLAENGHDGTILFTTASPKIASAPLPVDGDKKAYIGTDTSNASFPLTWYSGYGATTDRVWFGANSGSLSAQGTSISATRSKNGHTVNVSVNNGTKYYWQVRSDSGVVLGPIWSFTTVNWQCPIAVANGIHHPKMAERSGTFLLPVENDPCMGFAGPEWDHNGDCVLDETDFAFFAKDWMNPSFGPPDQYWQIPVMGYTTLRRIANEWLDCIARTNNGCNGW
jgi:hypothetical protein